MTTSPLARLEISELLSDCKKKLDCYHEHTRGEYPGGPPNQTLYPRIDKMIATLRAEPVVGEWLAIESAPYATWVLAWLHLPKNPIASSWAIAQRCNVEKDESAADYSEHQRRTVGCWWAHGRYYPAGHVIAYQPLPPPPAALPGLGGRDG